MSGFVLDSPRLSTNCAVVSDFAGTQRNNYVMPTSYGIVFPAYFDSVLFYGIEISWKNDSVRGAHNVIFSLCIHYVTYMTYIRRIGRNIPSSSTE